MSAHNGLLRSRQRQRALRHARRLAFTPIRPQKPAVQAVEASEPTLPAPEPETAAQAPISQPYPEPADEPHPLPASTPTLDKARAKRERYNEARRLKRAQAKEPSEA